MRNDWTREIPPHVSKVIVRYVVTYEYGPNRGYRFDSLALAEAHIEKASLGDHTLHREVVVTHIDAG